MIDLDIATAYAVGATQARAAQPFNVQLAALQGRSSSPWREPSIREALGVPAINRAVTLISNTAGALSVDGFRNGTVMASERRPRLIVRPNPLTTPRAFYRDTALHKATRGESWWWIAKRDSEGVPLSLFPVPPWQVKVEANPHDPRYPVIRWGDQIMPNADMIQDMLMPDPDNPLRGAGPLQLCLGAVSVAVEAQEWAANFYAEGGYPSVYLRPDVEFPDGEDDATKLKQKWTANPPNTPQVISPGLEVGTVPVNEQGSQMLGARVHNFGEVALMFGIPGSMVEYVQSGSSVTYQNVGQRFDDFVKGCLWPNYLEGTEQSLSDLLPRNVTARFDVDAFTRPDPKTRYEIHAIAIAAGIYDVEEARMREGFAPGSIETAPIPDAPDSELPPPAPLKARSTPAPVLAVEYRCDGMRLLKKRLVPCGKLLAESGAFTGTCPRCKKEHGAA